MKQMWQNSSVQMGLIDLVNRALALVKSQEKVEDCSFFHRNLRSFEKEMDSNERELLAGLEVLFGSEEMLQGKTITLHFDNENASTHLLLGKLAFPHFPPKCKMFSCCDALKVYGIDSLHERYPKHRRKWMPGAKALPKMFQKLKILQIKPSGGFQMGGK